MTYCSLQALELRVQPRLGASESESLRSVQVIEGLPLDEKNCFCGLIAVSNQNFEVELILGSFTFVKVSVVHSVTNRATEVVASLFASAHSQ